MAKKRHSRLDSYREDHAFQGDLPFDLVYEFLGKRYTLLCAGL
jgi:hypothetical protein